MSAIFGTRDEIEQTKLVRNHDMVHRIACYRVKDRRVVPWRWAEGKTRSEVAAAAENGLKFCGSCHPLDYIDADHEVER